jgi:hypothetical protein
MPAGIKGAVWIIRVALGGFLGFILTSCSGGLVPPASVSGSDALPPALQAWAAFPVNASPRPLVVDPGSADGPRGVYGDQNTKLALLGGAFDRPAQLPAGPATADGYPIISADQAFDLLHPHPGAIAGIRLTLTEARLGKASFGTDRGSRMLPAWLFSFARVDGPIPVLAVAPAARWFPSGLTAGGGGQPYWAEAVLGLDRRTLTVSFIGAQSESGSCGVKYEVKLTESPTAVMVTRISHANESTAACTLMGFVRHASATLKVPLGPRVLVDDLGYPMGVNGSP